jgi:uncharacterized HAD superfamily protein/hypoxanthine phosphoribosyltransferase
MAYFEYRSFSDLNQAIIRNLAIFPHDIDLIVGIPRSGMLPANLLALYLNKPYTDIDSFIEKRIYAIGERMKNVNSSNLNKILIIDDYIASGKALSKVKEKIGQLSCSYNISYGTVYAAKRSINLVDFYCEAFDDYGPSVFEWNIFLYPALSNKTCYDIDGVLCIEPPVDVDDDGEKYTSYISNAPPLYLPSGEIDSLVTCRLEKYRAVTIEWLKKWHINYKNLIMLNFQTKDEREEWGKYGIYKGEVYKKNKCVLFIESSLKEAMEIKRISGKPVFCTETFAMINNNIHKEKIINKLKKLIPRNIRNILRSYFL